jgi:hypothetical protein
MKAFFAAAAALSDEDFSVFAFTLRSEKFTRSSTMAYSITA